MPGGEGQYGAAGHVATVDARGAVDRFVLANGLEVWHRERPNSGTVSLIMVVRAGARYETTLNNGISHFVEHTLFDGTAR